MSSTPPTERFPVDYQVEARLEERNRLTCAFRIILAIPHAIIVGAPAGLGTPSFIINLFDGNGAFRFALDGGTGVLGLIAYRTPSCFSSLASPGSSRP